MKLATTDPSVILPPLEDVAIVEEEKKVEVEEEVEEEEGEGGGGGKGEGEGLEGARGLLKEYNCALGSREEEGGGRGEGEGEGGG